MKLKNIILALVVLPVMFTAARAAEVIDLSREVEDIFTVYTSNAEILRRQLGGEDSVVIACENSGKPSMAALTTGSVNLGGDMAIALRTAVDDDGGAATRMLYLNDSVPLLKISGTSVTLLDVGSVDIAPEELTDIDISYADETGTAMLWVDGSLALSGSTKLMKNQNKQSSKLTFSAYITGSKGSSRWYIAGLCTASGRDGTVKTYPADGDTVDASELRQIDVELALFTNYGRKNGAPVKLFKDGKETAFTTKISGTKINLVPEGGFAAGCEYGVELSGGTDVFGDAADGVKFAFTAVPDGYTMPKIRLTSPASGARVIAGESVGVAAEVTPGSEPVEKVEIFVDGTLYKALTDAPYSCDYKAQSGRHTLSAAVTDTSGVRAASAEIEVIGEDNVAPSVEILGVTEGGEVLMNTPLRISASDANGNLERTEAYLDGVKLNKNADGSFSYPENISLGKKTLKVYAYDSLNARASDTRTAYFTRADVSELLKQDMSTYNAGRNDTKFAPGMMGNVEQGVVYSETLGGRRAMVLEVPDGKKGKTVFSGISWVGTSDMPKKRFVIETDICFDSVNSRFMSVVRSNEETVRFSERDIDFADGTLTLSSSGSAVKTVKYEANVYYSLRFEVDLERGTYSFYMDGKELCRDFALAVPVPNVSMVRFHFAPRTDAAARVGFARFDVTDMTPLPYLKSADLGSRGLLALDAGEVAVTFNRYFADEIKVNSASLSAGGENAAITYAYDSESGRFTVTLADAPQASCEYTLSLEASYMGKDFATDIVFSSEGGDFDVKGCGFKDTDGGISFYADIKNETGSTRSALALIIKYEEGIMTGVKCAAGDVPADGARLTTPGISADGKDVEIIGVVWDGWADRKPLNNQVYTYQK